MSVPGWLVVLDSIGFFTVRTLLSLLWQSSILLGAVGILTLMLRHKRESIRYSLWLTAVFVIPVIPLLTYAFSMIGTPQAEISVLPAYSAPQARIARTQLKMKLPEGYRPRRIIRSSSFNNSKLSPAYPAPETFRMEQDEQLSEFSIKYYPWAAVLVVYSSIVLLLLMLMAAGRLRIRNWIYNGNPVINTDVIDIFHNAARRIGLTRDFIIIESDDVPAPMTCRTFHPIIVLPTGFYESLSAAELMAVALHELTHVKRNDVLIMTFVSCVRTIFFFHPLVWLAARQISYLSEVACDDAVLKSSLKSTSYAGMLSRMAANLPNTAYSTELAVGILFSKSVFFRRIEIILSNRNERFMRLSRVTLTGTVAIAALSLIIALALPLGYAQDKGDMVIFSGTVVYKGKPVSDADIYMNNSLLKQAKKITKSDRNGSFSFELPQSVLGGHPYIKPAILACSPRYAVGWVNITGRIGSTNLRIVLEDMVPLTGIVSDESGSPLAEAVVSVSMVGKMVSGGLGYIRLGKDTVPELSVRTDREGRFNLKKLPTYSMMYITVSKDGYAVESKSYRQTGVVDVKIALKPGGSIRGKVVNGESGKPVSNVRVLTSIPGDPIGTIETHTDSDGNYTLTGLQSSTYAVKLMLDDTMGEWAAATLENITVTGGQVVDLQDFSLVKGGTVTGRILNEDTGAPIPRHWVGMSDANSGNNFLVKRQTVTDENGFFTFTAVPGKVEVVTFPPDGYEDSGALNGSGEVRREVEVIEGENQTLADVTFRKGIVLHGTVRTFSGEPVEGASISDNRNTVTVSDKNGAFSITGLKPDAGLSLYATQDEKKLRGKVDLKIQPGVQVEILMDEYETTGITGRVIDDNNNPIPDIAVQLVLMDPDSGRGSTGETSLTDTSGMYSFNNLIVGGDYLISVSAEGYRTPSLSRDDQFIAEPNMPPHEDMVITKGDRWLEGFVTNEAGNKVPGASISVRLGGSSGSTIRSTSDANGHFRLEGLIGVMLRRVSIRHKDYGRYEFHYIPTNLPYECKLIKGTHSLTGKVVDTEGNPVNNAHVYARDQYHPAGTMNIDGRSSDDGSFTIDTITEDTVRLSVSTNNREYKHKFYGPFKTDGREEVTLVLVKSSESDDAMEYTPSTPNTLGPYSTRYIQEKNIITVDGDLSDWAGMDISVVHITESDSQSNESSGTSAPPSEEDLSAQFKCIADDDFVYLSVDVTDDNLYFKNPGFDSAWGQDCIEMFFFGDGKDEAAGQLQITAYENGEVMLSGRDPITNERYPYFWEAAGVRAALQQHADGYSAEIALPWSLLQWSGWGKGRSMGMNIRVYDSDVDEADTWSRYLVEWANIAGEDYQKIIFDGMPEVNAAQYRSPDLNRIHDILTIVQNKNWDNAEEQLRKAGDSRWVNPMRGRVLQLAGKEDESITLFSRMVQETGDNMIEDWIVQSFYRQAMSHRSGGEHKKIISILEPLVVDCENRTNSIVNAKLLLGQCFFSNADYDKARQLMVGLLDCDDSIKNYYGQNVPKDAQRMIDSIDRVLAAY